MRRHAIRRNPATGNWVMYWFDPYRKAYVIIGSAYNHQSAIKAL